MAQPIEELRTVPNLLENAADFLRAEGYDEEALAAKLLAGIVRPWLRMYGLDTLPVWEFRRRYLEIMQLLLGGVPDGTLLPAPPAPQPRRGEIVETLSEGVDA